MQSELLLRATVEVLRRRGRLLLLTLGVAAVCLLVWEAGPRGVLEAVLAAGIWLPAVLLLELSWAATDVLALGAILGPRWKQVPMRAWLQSSFIAYAVMILVPIGRTGAEVTRATMLLPYLGIHAVAAGVRLQAVTLTANGLSAIPCLAAVLLELGPRAPLTWLVGGNGLITLALGLGIFVICRRSSIGRWLGLRFPAIGTQGTSLDDTLRAQPALPVQAILISFLGRSLQTLQYGLLLHAVGGVLSLRGSLLSQGIHLVGAGFGDFVPNAVGITEGAYRIFAQSLGLAPAAAVAIALLARLCQLFLATVALLARPRVTPPETLAPSSPGPGAHGAA